MRKLKIGVIDLTTKKPNQSLWARAMNANLAGIMPQVIATWCEQEGHDVTYECFTGPEEIADCIPTRADVVFISSFTQAALFAYSLSQRFRSRGAVTVLGGPHARCYPQDAQKYFDYVMGFTDRGLLREMLAECAPHRPLGRRMAATAHPRSLPGVRERWKFIEQTLKKAPILKLVPMIGSMGCPYSCSFCIDSQIDYQPLPFEELQDDLRFLRTKFERPRVGWHDPNFGIRFDDYMDMIDAAVPPGSVSFVAESSLAVLSEPHLQRMKKSGFMGILPGIESWFDMGGKAKAGTRQGLEKVEKVAEHINLVLRYLPYVQTNFVLGLDSDVGDAPYTLTKRFLDLAPAAFPAYSLLTAFGQAAPLNEEYRKAGRVIPFPFHLLDNNKAMNVKPVNYTWPQFYDRLIDLSEHSFSWKTIGRRFSGSTSTIPRWLNVVRAVSSEGFGRLKYYREVRRRLEEDRPLRDYLEQETTVLPDFYLDKIKADLGPYWNWLPHGAVHHDPMAAGT